MTIQRWIINFVFPVFLDWPLVLLERPGLNGLAEPEGLRPQLGVRPVVALVTRVRYPLTNLHPPEQQSCFHFLFNCVSRSVRKNPSTKLFFYKSGSFILRFPVTKQLTIVKFSDTIAYFARGSQNLTNTIILQRPCVWAYTIEYTFLHVENLLKKAFHNLPYIFYIFHMCRNWQVTEYKNNLRLFFPFQVQNYTCLKFYRRSACYTLTDINEDFGTQR